MDRRQKLALDESYHYYITLDKNGDAPNLYKLAKCFKTVTYALKIADGNQFKLTKQLWKRIHQALFDKLITSFPGYVLVVDENGKQIMPKEQFPDCGSVEFHPEGCRRTDDIFQMEIKHLYPATQYKLAGAWKTKGAMLKPADFAGPACGEHGCFLQPVVLGQEVLHQESQVGKEQAYQHWWELYWQAYCAKDKHEQNILYRQMDELEQVWGNLYY